MVPRIKKTRARSEEKKAKKFEKILDAGKELFLNKGSEGFSMRNLAEKLGMTKNNLYNYFISKRELWIAIRNKFYTEFKEENIQIIKNHKGTTFDLLIKLFNHFLKFAERDFDKFKMMFNIISAPPSSKMGPIERKYKEYRLLEGTMKIFQKAIERDEIENKNPALLSLISFSLVIGIAYIEMNITIFDDLEPQPILELTQTKELNLSKEEIHKYTIKVLKILFKEDI